MIRIKVITAGTEWWVDADGGDAVISVESPSGLITFECCWSDVRVITDRFLQALVDNDEAMPVEVAPVGHIDDTPLLGMPAPVGNVWGGKA